MKCSSTFHIGYRLGKPVGVGNAIIFYLFIKDRGKMLYRVKLDYACYGLVIEKEIVIRTPPIARWMQGKNIKEIERWIRKKGGRIDNVL